MQKNLTQPVKNIGASQEYLSNKNPRPHLVQISQCHLRPNTLFFWGLKQHPKENKTKKNHCFSREKHMFFMEKTTNFCGKKNRCRGAKKKKKKKNQPIGQSLFRSVRTPMTDQSLLQGWHVIGRGLSPAPSFNSGCQTGGHQTEPIAVLSSRTCVGAQWLQCRSVISIVSWLFSHPGVQSYKVYNVSDVVALWVDQSAVSFKNIFWKNNCFFAKQHWSFLVQLDIGKSQIIFWKNSCSFEQKLTEHRKK